MYTYNCIVRRVVDADTIDVDLDLGFDTWIHGARIRLFGVDAPETRTRDLEEKHYGNLATEFVKEKLQVGNSYIFRSHKFNSTDSFGRILGDFIVVDRMLTDLMLENYHAVEWNSSNPELMKEQHLKNREMLKQLGE